MCIESPCKCGCRPSDSIKIETGKSYRTKDGHKVRIIATDVKGLNGITIYGLLTVNPSPSSLRPCEFEQGVTYRMNGTTPGNDPKLQIVCEWKEPVIHRRDIIIMRNKGTGALQWNTLLHQAVMSPSDWEGYDEVFRQTVEYTE